jgi:hypothetical protein
MHCCGGAPSNGQPVDIIVRSFQFIPLGTSADAIKPHTGLAAPTVASACNGSVLVKHDRPANHERCVHVLDTRDRVIRKATIPTGAKGISIPGIGAGVHMVNATARAFPVTWRGDSGRITSIFSLGMEDHAVEAAHVLRRHGQSPPLGAGFFNPVASAFLEACFGVSERP